MIVIVSRDTLFATMLQYELQDNTAQQVQLFADTNEQRDALQAALQEAQIVVTDMDLPADFQQEQLSILSMRKTPPPLLIFGFGIHPNAPFRRMYENSASSSFFFRPFSMQLFLSRVTGLLALRAHAFADPIPERAAPSSEKRELPELSDLKIETSTRRAICGEMSVQFSVREFQVFSYLFARRGKWVSREELLRAVWGTNSEKSNIVDVYIRYLRQKLDQAFHIKIIYAVRGVGYTIPNNDQEVLRYAQGNSEYHLT